MAGGSLNLCGVVGVCAAAVAVERVAVGIALIVGELRESHNRDGVEREGGSGCEGAIELLC